MKGERDLSLEDTGKHPHNIMSNLKSSIQRFNNRLDRGKEKEKRINELEERSVESIHAEKQKEKERNIESQWELWTP